MQCAKVAPIVGSSKLSRINSKKQFNYANILSVNIMGRRVPIVCQIRLTPRLTKRVIINSGAPIKHKCFVYDEVYHKACCRKVIRFNINHYMKCYLPGRLGTNGAITTPYILNHCKKCNVSIVDKCGRSVSFQKSRFWFNGTLIWKAPKVIQMCANCSLDNYPIDEDVELPYVAQINHIQYNTSNNAATSVVGEAKGCSSCGGKI